MTRNASFIRKIIYGCAIVVLLFPLFLLGQPATESKKGGSDGGILAQMRSSYGLSQAKLGEIDPASETMKMATLGLRGVATNLLWTKANGYKHRESWDRLSATLNQIAKLQPNYITVWEFQAHNLSYNVSAEFDDYRHRYHWVKKGIEFLMEGTRYNQRSPRLFWNIGWFVGHKIGKSDEKKEFRQIFPHDKEFHDEIRAMDTIQWKETMGATGYPDNWLVAYLWYQQSARVVDKGVPVTWLRTNPQEEGLTAKRRSSLIFYSDPSMALIGHADSVTSELTPGERTQNAWREAKRELVKFGEIDIPTSWGHTLRLANLEKVRAEEQRMRGKLESLATGLREEIEQERRDALAPEEKVLLERMENGEELPKEMWDIIGEAQRKMAVADLDVASRIPEDLQVKGRYFAMRASEAKTRAARISSYGEIVNYDYWNTRCDVEQSKVAADARKFMLFGNQAALDGDPEGAREHYEKAWSEWARIFDEYPQLVDDEMAVDLRPAVARYRQVLDQLDEKFPTDFKLKILLEKQIIAPDVPDADEPDADESAGDEPAGEGREETTGEP